VESKFSDVVAKLQLPEVHYPVPEVTVVSGFFIVWLLERLIHKCVDRIMLSSTPASLQKTVVVRERQKNSDNVELLDEYVAVTDEEFPLDNGYHSHEDGSGHQRHHHSHKHGEDGEAAVGHSHLAFDAQDAANASGVKVIKAVFLTFALGSHSVLEGIGFGLLDNLTQILNMIIAMIIHESLCALSLGLHLAGQQTRPRLAAILLTTFSVLIPIGVVIGLSVSMGESTVTGQMASCLLQGIAAGTFIYVVFLEILPPELKSGENQLWKVALTALGFVLIAVIRAFSTEH